MDAQQYDDAMTWYSAALSLDPAIPQDVLIKRSKVYMAMGLWEDALDDTSKVCHFYFVQVWSSLDTAELGNDALFGICMGLREGIDGVGESQIDRWVMEKHLEKC